jgi:transmembrane sensor
MGAVLVFVSAIVVAAAAMIGSELLAVSDWINPSHIETAVGQQRTITLEDGSTVEVNTHTAVTVHFTPRKREVRLADGEARFTVAKNRERPFIVTTPQACVRAVGTVFNVQVGSHRTAVAVFEGQVRVFGRAEEMQVAQSPILSPQPKSRFVEPPEDLYAGQRAAVSRTGTILRDAGPSIERVSAWTRRQLVFRDEPLSDLVAEFNRYHNKALRIEDPGLAGFRVSGTFDAYDLRSLMQYLENYQGVHAHQAPDGTEVLTR